MTPTDADVDAFVAAIPKPVRRRDAETLIALYRDITGEEPRMWGPSIIGFGHYHYTYATGREGDAGAAGFSPRAASTTIYLPDGFDAYADDLAELGPHKVSVACLYLGDLTKVDLTVLRRILERSWAVCSAPGFGQV